jgi:hypothetical protein
MKKLTIKLMLAQLLAIGSLMVAGLGTASAATPDAAAALKATPAAPTADRNALLAPSLAKPHAVASPAITYTVSLSASSTSLWPTQYTTLTATTNSDIGPTPYYLEIFDTSTGGSVAICGTGTTCSASVTQTAATTHYYRAYVAYYSTTNPPTGIQATSGYAGVNWKSVGVTLSVNPSTVNVGASSTLSTVTTADIGPSPFWTQIFDLNTGARVGYCGFGTTCSATVSQSVATTHRFRAYVASYGTSLPLTNVQATSLTDYVTWSNAGYRLSLTTSRTSAGHDTVTATSNVNVGPTPWYIEIFNVNTGARIAVCGTGTTCSANVALNYGANNFVAFTSSYDTALPPANIQASSKVVTDNYFIFIP